MLITVIIPVYNSADTIAAALDSVVAQSVLGDSFAQAVQLELVVVDDGSTDTSREVAADWRESCSNPAVAVQLLQTGRNLGPAGARNAGIAVARGDWIAFLDADDEWLPDKLQRQVAFVEAHPDAVLVCGASAAAWQRGECNHKERKEHKDEEEGVQSYRVTKDRDETEDYRLQTADLTSPRLRQASRRSQTAERRGEGAWSQRKREGGVQKHFTLHIPPSTEISPSGSTLYSLNDFAIKNPVITSTVLVRKAALEAVGGFDEQFRGPEDYDLWMRIASAAAAADAGLPSFAKASYYALRASKDETEGKQSYKVTKVTKDREETEDYRLQTADYRLQTADLTSPRLRQASRRPDFAKATSGKPQTAERRGDGAWSPAGCGEIVEPRRMRGNRGGCEKGLRSNPIYALNVPLVFCRTRSGSLSMDERPFLPQVLRVLDKAYGPDGALAGMKQFERRARANQYAGASWMAFCRGARGAALRLLGRSLACCLLWPGSGRWKLALRYARGR